jgi:putative FmdB family regulatory protein
MPTYAYACDTCGFAKDEWLKVSEALPELVCPSCGKPTYRKQLTAPAFQLKGGGWYVTDFRNGGGASELLVARPQLGDVEVGEDVAVDRQHPLVQPGDPGGERNGSGGVERLWLHRVEQTHAGAGAIGELGGEGVGLVAEREHDLVHAVAALWASEKRPAVVWIWTAGIVIFSGSLYLLAVTNVRWLGAITPIGGILFLIGWGMIAFGKNATRSQNTPSEM